MTKRRAGFLTILMLALVAAALIALYVRSRLQSASVIPGRGDGLSFFLPLQAGFDNEDWYVSDFTIRSTFFRVGWVPENVHYDGETLALELTRIPVDNQPNSGAEVQKRGFYGYGRYEVVMQAAPGSGVVSAFFTHTDETFGDPHDEIDIEFLGNDTRRMHANVFTNGISNGSIYIDLPFDAAESVHLYAFDWRPDSVRWYIDNELVHTVTSAEQAIPSTPGRVIMDIWTGSKAQYSWHGEPTFQDGTKAYYYCVSFQALGDTSPQCSDHTESAPGGIVSPTSPTVE